ncbi:MAG: LytR C-terminal domain-containing protein [Candidatus Levybacteria bacterium]|nr:LytR C-terminal domain-containing protein [Candidatus Levybacteria bacterium]
MHKWILSLLLIISVVFGAIFFSIWQISQKNIIINPSIYLRNDPFPTDYITLAPVVTIFIKPTISTIDPILGLDRRDLVIAVQNGSDIFGGGTKMSEVLKDFGYHIESIERASQNTDITSINIKEDKNKYLPLLIKDLSLLYKIGTFSASLNASSSADVIIVVGGE